MLTELDKLIAGYLQKKHPTAPRALLEHLTLATRLGHLCLKAKEDSWFPSLNDLACEANIETNLIKEPSTTAINFFEDAQHLDGFPTTAVCRYGNALYLQNKFVEETLFLRHLKRLLKECPYFLPPKDAIQKELQAEISKGTLLKEQAGAIEAALFSSLGILSGGPGTGKTYTAGRMIKILLSHLNEEDRKQFSIILAAPTGRAASKLKESLTNALPHSTASTKTLHALLKGDYESDTSLPLPYDLIVVDECSMIDSRKMAQLFCKIKKGARLLLLGDQDQLPPLEGGTLFEDLKRILEKISFFSGSLKKCMRSDSPQLISFFEAVRTHDADKVIKIAFDESQKEVESILTNDLFPKELLPLFAQSFVHPQSTEDASLFKSFMKFKILSPLAEGGVDRWNRALFEHFWHKTKPHSLFYAPILITKNDWELGLMNGECGVMVLPHPGDRKAPPLALLKGLKGAYAIFSTDSSLRKVALPLLPSFDLSYAMTVHKSQGCEFEKVALLLNSGNWNQKLLYTAATRAKKHLTLVGTKENLLAALKPFTPRASSLEERFRACLESF